MIDHVVFNSWTSSEFVLHVNEWQPPFILIDDCSDLPQIENEDDDDNSATISSYPYALMLSCVILQLHVASFFDIERHGRKVNAFVISPHETAVFSLNKEVTALIEKEEEEEESTPVDGVNLIWDSLMEMRKGVPSRHIGLRELIIAQFMKDNQTIDEAGMSEGGCSLSYSLFASSDEEGEINRQLAIYMGKMLLIVSQLSRQLPLAKRVLIDFEKEVDEEGEVAWQFDAVIDGLIQFYLDEASNILDQSMSFFSKHRSNDQPSWTNFEVAREASDFVDFRLLKTVMTLATQAAESSGDWYLCL